MNKCCFKNINIGITKAVHQILAVQTNQNEKLVVDTVHFSMA